MKQHPLTIGSQAHALPLAGASNPSTEKQGTSVGSFANEGNVGGANTFSSPDTPGMPTASSKTAWDFNQSPHTNPVTQLEHARLGTITPEMVRVAQREPHLTAEQIRDEVAAGRLIIPANTVHLKKNLDPMTIGRGSLTKVNANMGASPVSSGTEEELEKITMVSEVGSRYRHGFINGRRS